MLYKNKLETILSHKVIEKFSENIGIHFELFNETIKLLDVLGTKLGWFIGGSYNNEYYIFITLNLDPYFSQK